jgi:hypothetical protein
MKRLFATTLAAIVSAAALAGPAPWYWWESKIDGQRVCSQTPLGPGWQRAGGPFSDARCEKPLARK